MGSNIRSETPDILLELVRTIDWNAIWINWTAIGREARGFLIKLIT